MIQDALPSIGITTAALLPIPVELVKAIVTVTMGAMEIWNAELTIVLDLVILVQTAAC